MAHSMHRRVRSNRSARSLAVFIRHACHSRRGQFLQKTRGNTENSRESLSPETRKLVFVKNLSVDESSSRNYRRLPSSIRLDRKEGLYRRKSWCQLESKRGEKAAKFCPLTCPFRAKTMEPLV